MCGTGDSLCHRQAAVKPACRVFMACFELESCRALLLLLLGSWIDNAAMQRYKHMLQQQQGEQVEQRQISVQNWWLHWEMTARTDSGSWELGAGSWERGLGVGKWGLRGCRCASYGKLTTDVLDNQTGNAGDFWTAMQIAQTDMHAGSTTHCVTVGRKLTKGKRRV